ncbi:hypothetical protein IG631_24356 [Alternaria alternata]|nr:hypothetical protein IG631_24356 [Alternaria alternata]
MPCQNASSSLPVSPSCAVQSLAVCFCHSPVSTSSAPTSQHTTHPSRTSSSTSCTCCHSPLASICSPASPALLCVVDHAPRHPYVQYVHNPREVDPCAQRRRSHDQPSV